MSLYKEEDITALILACRERDDNAFVEIVSRYTPMMNKLIASFSSLPFTYDELFSESCIALHRAVCSFRLEQNEVTFGLYARVCISHQLSDLAQSHSVSVSDIADVDVDSIAASSEIDAKLERKERFDNILKIARDLLSDYEYRVLLLHIQGYKTREISKLVEKDSKSVDNAKNRIFTRLRTVFAQRTDD